MSQGGSIIRILDQAVASAINRDPAFIIGCNGACSWKQRCAELCIWFKRNRDGRAARAAALQDELAGERPAQMNGAAGASLACPRCAIRRGISPSQRMV